MAWNATSRAAALSVISNSLLIAIKLAAGLAVGSVAILSQALDSGVDLLAALIAFFSLRVTGQPADREHPYGHGKLEGLSAAAQAVLIVPGLVVIAWQAVLALMRGPELRALEWGAAVMGFSAVVDIVISRHLLRVARREDSLALEADARHLTTDVYSAAGVMVGLVAVRLTGLRFLDPLVALAVSGIVVHTIWVLIRRAYDDLVDVRLPDAEEVIIRNSIEEHMGEMVGFHDLRTRKSGRERYIDLHLVVARHVSVEEAHRLADHLEEDVMSKLPHSSVTIHIEPCSYVPGQCPARCHLARDASCPALKGQGQGPTSSG